MTKGPRKDVAASVRQRLANRAKANGRPFHEVLQHYSLDRWLYRLSQSAYRDRLILKGALLIQAWKAVTARPTRDIDLLGRLHNDLERVRAAIVEICDLSINDDGLVFHSATVTTLRITEDATYAGVRATFQATLGNARIPMQIDIGFSDVVTPSPMSVTLPAILDFPPAILLGYNRETVIAEKFEAMIKLGELNSRMKDFFDVYWLAMGFDFDGQALAAAMLATFEQRSTKLASEPICFTESFATDSGRVALWRAFLKRSQIDPGPEFREVIKTVREFLQPVTERISHGLTRNAHWTPGGPWGKVHG